MIKKTNSIWLDFEDFHIRDLNFIFFEPKLINSNRFDLCLQSEADLIINFNTDI